MTRNVAQVSLFAVGLLVGLLLIGQLRSQARPTEISSLSAQELSQLIETLSNRNRELRTALSDQRDTLREYEAAGPVGQSALQVSREDLRAHRRLRRPGAGDGAGDLAARWRATWTRSP